MKKEYAILNGYNQVILSVPHCIIHKRNGSIRPSEDNVLKIAKKVAEKTKSHLIYKYLNKENDANFDEKSQYKEFLKEYVVQNKIKYLIDLHGMCAQREQDICIGINKGKNIYNRFNLSKKMVNIFEENNFKNVTIDTPFDASFCENVSNRISRECKIPCFQIEINRKYRNKRYKGYNLEGIVDSLVEIVKFLENE